MPSIFADMGQSWLTETLRDSSGHSVTYRRGSDDVELIATFGRSEFQLTSGEGSYTAIESHDFIVIPSDLQIGGASLTPRAGDKIFWTVGGSTREYRVIDQPGFQPCKFDPQRKTLRIYTIKVSA